MDTNIDRQTAAPVGSLHAHVSVVPPGADNIDAAMSKAATNAMPRLVVVEEVETTHDDDEVHRLRREIQQRREYASAEATVRANNALKPAEREVVLAAIHVVESGRKRGKADARGFVKTSRAEVAAAAGVSPNTAGTHLQSAATWGLVLKERRTEQFAVRKPGQRSPELRTESAIWLAFSGHYLDAVRRVGCYVPQRKGSHGGRRDMRCPECGATFAASGRYCCPECGINLRLSTVDNADEEMPALCERNTTTQVQEWRNDRQTPSWLCKSVPGREESDGANSAPHSDTGGVKAGNTTKKKKKSPSEKQIDPQRSPRTSPLYRAAYHLAVHMNIPVFPLYEPHPNGGCTCALRERCSKPGKHPRCRHGFNDATTNPKKIYSWWYKHPNANIGIATGPAGLVVIDIDLAHDGGASWQALLQEVGAKIENTLAVQTGSGYHLYYWCPEGLTFRSSAGELAPGIDIRAEKGYVVAPPSVHASGRPYAWFASSFGEFAPLPEVLAERLERLEHRDPADISAPGSVEPVPMSGSIPESQRNRTLFRIASKLRGDGMEVTQIFSEVQRHNQRCEPPLPLAEVRAIARSAAKYPKGSNGRTHARATSDSDGSAP